MTKRFQKRYIEKNNKVYDTFKEMSITDELNSDSLLNVLSHLNGFGEMIDIKIEQGKYCMKKYKELEDENEQLKSDYSEQCIQLDFLKAENSHMKQVLEENEQLKQQVQNIHKLIDKKITEVKREYNKYSINSDQAEASIDTLIDLKKELNVE